MTDKKTIGTNIKGIDIELHSALKKEAIDRGISVNGMYLKIIKAGAKRLKIVN